MKLTNNDRLSRHTVCFLDGTDETIGTICANEETGEIEQLVKDPIYPARHLGFTRTLKGKVQLAIKENAPEWAIEEFSRLRKLET